MRREGGRVEEGEAGEHTPHRADLKAEDSVSDLIGVLPINRAGQTKVT